MIESLPLLGAGGCSAAGLEFTVVDIRTTGLRSGRVVELAAVRVSADGSFGGELTTLVDPGPGVPPGPALVHGITRGELDGAPSFGEVLGPFLDLCAGSVLVAHDLASAGAFLDREIGALGVRMPVLPGVSTQAAARSVVRLPNYRPATVAHALGVPTRPGQSALSGARTVAQLVVGLFGRYGLTFASPPVLPGLPRFADGRLLPRGEALPAEPGWMAEAVERIPGGGAGDAYLDLLAGVVADQHLAHDEVAALAVLASEAGLSEGHVRATHERLVTALREIAERDGVVTAAESRELRQVATALGVADAGELQPTAAGKPTRVLVLGTTVAADRLRARVLAEGVQLAKKLTASVTHLVADASVPADEPRLMRAAELGAVLLDVGVAPVALGFEPPPAPPAATAARMPKLVGGRVLMGIGLLLMFIVVVAMFAGTPLAAGIFLAVFGVGALLGGWWLAEPAPR
ncbi:DNA polymerase III subunit epsilon [Amycolatopsis mediterranei S699]|uniref:DNA polymerase III subunit epsilon n=2 Tax=Amycolatopsis mediterranei TaxID=33910 RepID=A0A0H3CXD7_AMYMU|nr:3'-5' exonuclease [Amycolatopsis mediterranei]ADJ41996.1 DNA polymerase III subunit epsilon [Amycolatopsis mediterranei U32]AEK38669.1 DNA polymerase III subunit epsilon [Amycolatopsis mediterranei S699]AFO73706.1 DNA polymerase III subunit epsilon [Amycolatopsis mediterranei S699]AGT80835.1 DNA polymerase III subunit epsilon [Amycolatopsis mediterranei RB]KDO08828.1 DNA polymerase III subunit epsilon [Amycolatopsis mediterranei]